MTPPDLTPEQICPVCNNDGWYEEWDDDGVEIVVTRECPRLNDPGHAPFNATGLLPEEAR